jgi:hypothetical protein
MPFRVTYVFDGLILFFLIGSERLMSYRIRLIPTSAVEKADPASLSGGL